MLKLTMNPRKRSKKPRAIPHRLRLPSTHRMDLDEPDFGDHEGTFQENLQAMLKQEATGKYDCTDYLSVTAWQNNARQFQMIKKPKFEVTRYSPVPPSCGMGPTAVARTPSSNARIDEYCREQIVEWSFRVVDYFRIDREVVAVSLSFLDRFLATYHCDRTSFKLAATTTLHLAVKLLYPCKLADLGILSDLSRGEFDMKDVCAMETNILTALQWNLHPPTAAAFTSIFLDYFFASRIVSITSTDLDDMYDVSSFFSELAVCDYFFVQLRPSTIAIASILNAVEGMYGPDHSLVSDILAASLRLRFPVLQHDVTAARNRLWELYERSEECALHNDKSRDDVLQEWPHGSSIFVKKASALSSPISVSKPCHSATDFDCSTHDLSFRNESW